MSSQWWPGGLGHTATHAVVMAKTISLGQDRGVHPFLVQVEIYSNFHKSYFWFSAAQGPGHPSAFARCDCR